MVVSLLGQKGGVGKSTFARLLATFYATAGWRVMLADLHLGQNSSSDWGALRLDKKIHPFVPTYGFGNVKKALLQQHRCDLIVFDGPPESHKATFDLAARSDLIIVPVSTTSDDLKPQVLFAHQLKARGQDRRTIIFAINCPTTPFAVAEAKSYVTDAGYKICNAVIPHKAGYELAQGHGRAICETNFPTLNAQAIALAQEFSE